MFGGNHASDRHGRAWPGRGRAACKIRCECVRCIGEELGCKLHRKYLGLSFLPCCSLRDSAAVGHGQRTYVVLVVGVLEPSLSSKGPTLLPPSPVAAATELIANDTPRQQPDESAPSPAFAPPRTLTAPSIPSKTHSRIPQHVLQAHCCGPSAGPIHCSHRSTPTPAIHPDPHCPDRRREGPSRARRPQPSTPFLLQGPTRRGQGVSRVLI